MRRWLRVGILLAICGSCLSTASFAAPREPVTARARADTFYAHRDWSHALSAYQGIAQREPDNGVVWYRIGVCHSSLEQWDRAVTAYRHAEAAGIPPSFSRYNLICAFARAGRINSALVNLERLAATGYGQIAQLEGDADLAAVRADARFAPILEQVRRNATPCAFAPESREFDFWIGDWEVHNNQGAAVVVGHSHVELILGECVIFENWTGQGGGSGKSFNAYNRQTHGWQQNWMDAGGRVTNYSNGHLVNGVMSFLADGTGPNGEPLKMRLSFHDLGKDRVRQHAETSSDGGATWSTTYDFLYLRQATAAK